MLGHGDRSGQDGRAEVLEFGRDRRAGRWRASRVLLVCLVIVTGFVVAVRSAGHQAASRTGAVPGPLPVRVISAGKRLLGVQAGWQLFARGPDDLLRIELARGRVTWTYVPPLETASPAVAFVVGAHEAVIRPFDLVPGYVVPDGGQARLLTGPLAGGGPLVPGPPGTQTVWAWATAGPPASPGLSLVTLSGHWAGPRIRFPPGGPQLPATAVPDGRGDALVASGSSTVYDAGPGWDRAVPGTIIAVGPASWLTVACGALDSQCRYQVIDTADGARRLLPGAAFYDPYFVGWPPAGVIAPDGSTAAVPEYGLGGATTVHLMSLRTGITKDLSVPIGVPSSTRESMAWSPDSRWLFVATTSGKLVAVNARSDQAQPLAVALPPVDQVAIRA